MSDCAQITIHESQFPGRVRADLEQSLRSREINHKFHYDSIKQTQKWLALHQAYSPSRTDPDCERIYEEAFKAAIVEITGARVHLIGLGCGGGQKDRRLLTALRDSGKEAFYSPVDVATAMVLTARAEALKVLPQDHCFPLVCDLAGAPNLREMFDIPACNSASRIITFFGMLPNFEPNQIMPRLRAFLRAGDLLLVSANLAPGPDYTAGVRKILPLYDNPLTRDWLMTFLLDLGVHPGDGALRFAIEDGESNLKRVVARFIFNHARTVQIDSESFEFKPGDSVRVFFSYRHTPDLLKQILAASGLHISCQWLTNSEEEGVFLART